MKTALRALYVVVILQIFNASAAVASDQELSPPGFTRPPDFLAILAGVAAKLGEAAAKAGRAATPRLGTAAIAPEVVKRAQEVTKPYYDIDAIIDRANNPNGF
jgi:hypothetical protein